MAKYRLPACIEKLHIKRCFVCAAKLSSENRTLEHLIPQWVIRAFRLERETITLSSGLQIRYMDFLVPCCRECNCELLGPREKRLARLFKREDRAVTDEMGVRELAVWGCKIIAGNKYYTQALTTGCQSSHHPKREIEPSELCRFYLRMIRGQVQIVHRSLEFPFSVFVFHTKLPPRQKHRFDFWLAPALNAFYIRLGRWSLICRFDGGYIALYGAHIFHPYLEQILAPLQVQELAAHFFTMAGRQAEQLLYVRSKRGGKERLEYVPRSIRAPFSEPVNAADFGHWFSTFTRYPVNKLVSGDTQIRTFLTDEDGHFLNLPPDAGMP